MKTGNDRYAHQLVNGPTICGFGILPCNKNKQTIDVQIMKETQTNYIKCKKQDTKAHILCDSVYVTF